MEIKPISLFGEVLFDHFPNGDKILGGAPFNVAWHLQAFGQAPLFISRVGNDIDGEQIRTEMQTWGMTTQGLQSDQRYPTGRVHVEFIDGEPSYIIVDNQAYDYISNNDPNRLCHNGILYHGTLAIRSSISKLTLGKIKKIHLGSIFIDVNLRQPWWHKTAVIELLKDADWLKLNLEEMQILSGHTNNIEASMDDLLKQYQLSGLIVTRGENGALALLKDGDLFSVAPAYSSKVVNTVGAGDAFSAVVLLGLNLGWKFGLIMERAQSFASAITTQKGATVNDMNFYTPFLTAWSLPVPKL